ncbi:hypothetical protein JCM14036_25200 [Desulfotomaculum defluvii]
MGTWSREMQVCASCRYWCGKRKIDSWACSFEVIESEGICNGPDGSFRSMVMWGSSSCGEWKPFRD